MEKAGALGLVIKDKGVQAIYGPKADVIKSDVQDALDSGVDIDSLTVDTIINEPNEQTTVQTNVTIPFVSVADGEVISIETVSDDVFSQKMMGDGFAVKPSNSQVVSPVSGVVQSIFPTKHAIGLLTPEGLEVLVHMGLDTVEMTKQVFDVSVKEGDTVKAGQLLATVDWKTVENEGRVPRL